VVVKETRWTVDGVSSVFHSGAWLVWGTIAALALWLGPAAAQPPDTGLEGQRIEELERLVPRLPDAFAADVLLRMAAFAPKAGKRREWLQESFRHARRVEHPPVAVKYFGTGGDTLYGYREYASALELDALSLPVRAAAAMAALDRRRAIELFGEIRKPAFPAGGCKAPLAPDPSIYYAELGKLAKAPPADKQEREALELLVDRAVANVSNAAEAMAAAVMVIGLEPDRERLETLLASLAAALLRLEGDFRSFVGFTTRGFDVFPALMQQAQGRGIDTRGFAGALRQWIVRNLNAPQCKDTLARLARGRRGGGAPAQLDLNLLPAVAGFNGAVAPRFQSGDGLPPISPEEVRPPREHDEPLAETRYLTSGKGRELSERIRRTLGRRLSPGKDEAASEAEIESEAKSLLEALRDWKPEADEFYLDHYHTKMVLYQALMRDVPAGPYREQAAREWGEFIDGSYDRMESKAEWAYYLLTHLVGRASESAQGAAVREIAARSHNPVLLAYVLLWRLKAGNGA
jgi:hypothetical protein